MESKLSNEELIGIDILENRIFYDPDNGTLIWKPLSEGVPDPSGFNKRLAGKAILTKRNGYICLQIHKTQLYGHRVAFYLYHGWLPEQVDHIDRDRSNIRIDNLRAATKAENMRNRTVASNSATGIKNISITSKGYYRISIRCDGKRYYNQFLKLEDAISWRDYKLAELHKSFGSTGEKV